MDNFNSEQNNFRPSETVRRSQQAALKKARVNDLVSVKGGRGLLSWFFKILVVLQVDSSRSWKKVFGAYARKVYRLVQWLGRRNHKPSVVYLSLYLKACSTLLQQSVGGHKLRATQSLGVAVSRTGSGLPRIIPALHRRKIRMGDPVIIRIWLTLFGLYRILEWTGKLKTSTITDLSRATAEWEAIADHLEPFYEKLAGLRGFSDKLRRLWGSKMREVKSFLAADEAGHSNPFEHSGFWNRALRPISYLQIVKSSPLNVPLRGFTSSSIFSQIMGAKAWLRAENAELHQALVGYISSVYPEPTPVEETIWEEQIVHYPVMERRRRVSRSAFDLATSNVDRRLLPGYDKIKELEDFIRDYPDINAERNKLRLAELRRLWEQTHGHSMKVETPTDEWEDVLVQKTGTIKVPRKVVREVSAPASGFSIRDFDLLEYIRFLAGFEFIKKPVVRGFTTNESGAIVPVQPEGEEVKLLNRRFNLGKLGLKIEPAGKVRVFALVDLFTQLTLRPLHLLVQDVLRGIPQDGTFDQVSPGVALGKKIRERGLSWIASYDLSAATDRLPISLQQVALQFMIGARSTEMWGELLTNRDYWLRQEPLRYAVGQPMGALSSWVMLAITHHFIIQSAAMRVYGIKSPWFELYYVLGDDMVIADEAVAKVYLQMMEELGVVINRHKSLVSNRGVFEFAKKLYRFEVELTPVSLKELFTTGVSAPVMIEMVRKYRLSLSDLLSLAGYRHGVKGRILGRFALLPKRAHTLLVCALSPTGPHAVPFKEWIQLVSVTSKASNNLSDDRMAVLLIQLWRDLLALRKRASEYRTQEWDPSDLISHRGPWQDQADRLHPFVEFSPILNNLSNENALYMWNTVLEELVIQRRTRLYRLEKRITEFVDCELSRRFFFISELDELASLYEQFQLLRKEMMLLIRTPFIQHADYEKDEPFLAKYKVWSKYGSLRPRGARTSERMRTLFLHDRQMWRKYGATFDQPTRGGAEEIEASGKRP